MKGQYEATAIERLKTFGPQSIAALDLGDLRGYADAKGFDRTVIRKMAERGSFGELFRDLVLRSEAVRGEEIDAIASAIEVVDPTASREYRGTDLQNFQIDTAIANSGIARGLKRYGSGASTFISPQAHVPHGIRNVPIAIVGYGAAGIMAAHTLLRLGFENITAYEKAKPLGIWAHQNVHGLSRNNPLELHFFDGVLKPAPGDGTEVKNFLNGLISIRPKEKRVVGIEPGTLKHRLNFADGTSAEYPIVINAMGLGRPKTVSDPRRMKTVTGEKYAGIRWQYRLEREKVAGQRIVLIGLGNSTAEMLRQIHTLNEQGYSVDYQILTHYPRDAVHNPTDYVTTKKGSFRVFRDTSRPNLVDYQGDLPLSRFDYYKALLDGKIISDVSRWEVEKPGTVHVFGKRTQISLPYDKMMTLIGYAHSEEVLKSFGCIYDNENRCGVFDFDGEVVSRAGKKNPQSRLHKGYFGFGAIQETPLNPNAIVLPGMMHRIGDLMFGIVMRAAELRKDRIVGH